MAEYKITYFDAAGAAEPTRWIFSHAGIKFEDERIDREKWPALKEKTPFGQLPLLTDLKTGKVVNQSIPICEFAAKKAKLTGSNDWENLEIQAIVHSFLDMKPKFYAVFQETDPQKKLDLIKSAVDETLTFYLGKFEAFMNKNNGYLAAGKLTWADIYVAATLESLKTMFIDYADIFKKFPKFDEHFKRVTSSPGIKKWIETRPKPKA